MRRIRLPWTVFSLFLILPMGPSAAAQPAGTLIFPRLGFEQNSFTGIAFVNPSGANATVTVTALGPNGTPLVGGSEFRNPVTLQVPAFQQRARVLADPELFGALLPPDRFGWIRAESDVPDVTGFFLFLNLDQAQSIQSWDGADLPTPGRKLIFPRVRMGNGYTTELNLINPGTTPIEVTGRLFLGQTGQFRESVRQINLAAQGMARLSLADDFGVAEAGDGSYLQVTGSGPIAGFQLVRLLGKDVIGLNARPAGEGFQILYFPQLAVLGPWTTRLGLINLSEEAVIANVFAHRPDGSLYTGEALKGANPTPVQLPPGGAIFRDVADLFQFEGTETIDGWLKVETARPVLNGLVSYGVHAAGSEAAVSLQPAALTRALFSHIAASPSLNPFTGIALLNPGQVANSVRVMAFDRDTGVPYGLFDGVLRPGERLSKLITELIPALKGQEIGGGFIWVRSEHPIYMTSLFGTPRVLANIPPQPSPRDFGPGDGAPRVSVSPPIAVVQPGRTQQFSLTGPSGNPAWQVNGQPGGSDATGRVSPAGVYTAPADIPSALPVTVSAEVQTTGGTFKAGATVDVLTKQILLEGVGVVQSVAYLRGLQRLFSAELEGLGAAGTGGIGYRANGTSVIYAAAPGNRAEILRLPDEEIVKMIEYRASTGRDYLLLCSRNRGRILRVDPTTKTSFEVESGLSQPNSMVIDAVTGNLLVADANQVWSIPRNRLEAGLTPAFRSRSGGDPGIRTQLVGDLQDARGVSVDICTSRIYVTEGTGRLLAIDRQTGARTQIPTGAQSPGQILGLYRKEIPCPDAFQLLLADVAGGTVSLVGPALGLDTAWANTDQSRTWDIAYLPIGSDIGTGQTDKAGILLSETAGPYSEISRVALVRVPDLYVDQQRNAAPPEFAAEFTDPVGDTFGSSPDPTDLWFLYSVSDWESVYFYLYFAQPIDPETLTGGVDLDVDRNAATGATSLIDLHSPHTSRLGVDFRIDLGSYARILDLPDQYEYGDLEVLNAVTGQVVEYATAFVTPDRRSMFISLSAPEFGIVDRVNYGVIVGNDSSGYTDVAPNGGYMVSDPLPPPED